MREAHLTINDLWLLPKGERVVVPFDRYQPLGVDADGLLGIFLGRLGADHKIFPISFKSWRKVPREQYKDKVWKDIIKVYINNFVTNCIF